MEAVLKLCGRAIFIDAGHLRSAGDVRDVLPIYLHSHSSSPVVVDLSAPKRRIEFPGRARLVKITPSDSENGWSFSFGKNLSLDLTINAISTTRFDVIIGIYSARGFEVATWTNKCSNVELAIKPGMNTFRIEYQNLRLLPGRYYIGFGIIGDRGYEDGVNDAVQFEVTTSPEAAKLETHQFGGALAAGATVSVLN
jgi:hypothetical protein